MVIIEIQTHLDSISGQKLQKKQTHFRSHLYFSFLLSNSASDEKYLHDENIGKNILHKIVSILYCRKYYSFCINKAESGARDRSAVARGRDASIFLFNSQTDVKLDMTLVIAR